ncbi:MAG: hypothetical protein LBE36_11610 [Flavobacteriaceae bacterium]|jgi:RNase P/RNase MRP subunit p30|nr:hypothetical protein [Flavobacteriaceae bacterium]
MSNDFEQNFSALEKNVLTTVKKYQKLNEKFNEISEELAQMKQKYEAEQKKSRILEEEHKNIKLYSAISGNPEHNRLMKNHINRLVKEIDLCIAQLQNSGL